MRIESYKELFEVRYDEIVSNVSIDGNEIVALLKPAISLPKAAMHMSMDFVGFIGEKDTVRLRLVEHGSDNMMNYTLGNTSVCQWNDDIREENDFEVNLDGFNILIRPVDNASFDVYLFGRRKGNVRPKTDTFLQSEWISDDGLAMAYVQRIGDLISEKRNDRQT